MYRSNHFFLSAMAATLFATAACSSGTDDPGSGSVLFSFNIEPDSEETARSLADAPDDMISTIEMFIFDTATGGLSKHLEFGTAGVCTADGLVLNREYIVYVMANCHPEEMPDRLSDMDNLSLKLSPADETGGQGIPMTGVSERFRHERDIQPVVISLRRAVSKIVITMDTSRLKGKFTAKSAVLHNAPVRVFPFAETSAAGNGDVADGDSATPADIRRFNDGNSIVLVTGENMQGTLLENNTDPWRKVPENIPSKSGCCTFLTVAGEYEYNGLTISELSFNMFLGEDNTSNFDIRRNRIYNLTLSISDEGAALTSSWKVERGAMKDLREISFDRDSISIRQNSTATLRVLCSPNPFDYDIIEGKGFRDASLRYSLNGDGTVTITSGGITAREATGRILAMSWDKRKSAGCDITVVRFRPEEHIPVGVHLEPKDTTIHVGDTLALRGYITYDSGDTLLDISAFDYLTQGDKILSKRGRSNLVVAEQPGTASALGILKTDHSLSDNCTVKVIL